MEKYSISRNVEISALNADHFENIPPHYRKGYFTLNNKNKDRVFLINGTIKYFLDKFSAPKTQHEVIDAIKTELQTDNPEITTTCTTFFDFLVAKNVLIPESFTEKILTQEAFYKQDDVITIMHDSQFNRLSVIDVLSVGQYIDVYLTRSEADNTRYVLKLLDRNKTTEEKVFREEMTDFKNEYVMYRNVYSVPYVCKAYTLAEDVHTNPLIIIEYCSGKSLSDYTDEDITEDDCFTVMEKILHAFSLIHQNNVVHGDIHASNILVDDNRDIKVIDLGFAQSAEPEKNEVPIFGGVCYYMPPERINVSSNKKYSKEADLPSDVYQLGILMYLIIYDTFPFEGFLWEDLAVKIKEEEPEMPENSAHNFTVSQEIIRLIKKCLSKNPADRFQNAGEILHAYHTFFAAKSLIL